MDTLKAKNVPRKTFNLSLERISIKSLKHEINIYQEVLNFLPLKKAYIYKL